MNSVAIQDLIGPENHCHGCGPENSHGHRIKSFWRDGGADCEWKAKPYHCAGATGIVNGGIIASLIDCHSVNTAMAEDYISQGREIGSIPKIWYVTASMSLKYVKPTPINRTLRLRADIKEKEGRKTWIQCSLFADEELCAEGEVLAVRIERKES